MLHDLDHCDNNIGSVLVLHDYVTCHDHQFFYPKTKIVVLSSWICAAQTQHHQIDEGTHKTADPFLDKIKIRLLVYNYYIKRITTTYLDNPYVKIEFRHMHPGLGQQKKPPLCRHFEWKAQKKKQPGFGKRQSKYN